MGVSDNGAPDQKLRILVTADAEVPVPPALYGGIERVIDSLVREFRANGHEVSLVAHVDSASPASEIRSWPANSSRGAYAHLRNAAALARAAREFNPDVIHSFSRLLWLLPLAADDRPKVMS